MISQRTVTETSFGPTHLKICKTWSLCFLREPILKFHPGQGLCMITIVCTIHFLCNIYGKPQLNNYLCNMLVYCLNFPEAVMKQHLFWFYSLLLVYGRPLVKDYRIDAWETGKEAVFSRKYYKRSVQVGSGKNSSCHSAPQPQPWLLPGSLYNPYHLPIWTRRFRRGELICVFRGPCTFLPAAGSFKEQVHERMNPRFWFVFILPLYHLYSVEFWILKVLKCWCDTHPYRRCFCKTALVHLFPREDMNKGLHVLGV